MIVIAFEILQRVTTFMSLPGHIITYISVFETVADDRTTQALTRLKATGRGNSTTSSLSSTN